MKNKRETYTENENLALLDQFGGICPLCNKPLMYQKQKSHQKNYEIAHIYPLNPSDEEKTTLTDVEKLADDPNDLDNLIPLCTDCHTRFDKPRTREEFCLVKKHKLAAKQEQSTRTKWYDFRIEQEVAELLSNLANAFGETGDADLDYDPKAVEEKLKSSMLPIEKQQIKADVAHYFNIVRRELREIDGGSRGRSELIAVQVKAFYLKLKSSYQDQHVIYGEMVKWVHAQGRSPSLDASRVLVSFFIQNCEVFE